MSSRVPIGDPDPIAAGAAQTRVVTARMSARWMSRKVARVTVRASPSSSSSGSSRQRSRAAVSSRADLVQLALVPVALVTGVQREPERPDRVGLPRPQQRRRHGQVLVDPGERERLREEVGALRRGRRERRLAVGDPVRVRVQHVADLLLVQPGDPRGPQRDQHRRGLLSVRIVGRVEDLLRRHEPEEAEQVDRAPDGGVEEDARLAGEVARERGEVGDAGVGDDQLRLRVRVHEPVQVVADRRQAASAVDQDRHAALGRELEDRVRAARRRAGTSARADGA